MELAAREPGEALAPEMVEIARLLRDEGAGFVAGGPPPALQEIVDGIQLLAETEGVFTETAGGVTVAVAQKLVQQGRIKPHDLTVLAITGNGLKTLDALRLAPPQVIEPKLAAFEEVLGGVYRVA